MQDYQEIKNYLAEVGQFDQQIQQTTHFNKIITHSPNKNNQQDLSEWTPSPKKNSNLKNDQKPEKAGPLSEMYLRLSLPKIRTTNYFQQNNFMLHTMRHKFKESKQYKQLINRLSCQALLAGKKKFNSEEYDEAFAQAKINTVLLKLPIPKYNKKQTSQINITNPLTNKSIELKRKICKKKKNENEKTKNDKTQHEHQNIRQGKTNQIIVEINQTQRWFNFIQSKQSKQKISQHKNYNIKFSFKRGRKPNPYGSVLQTSDFYLDNRKQR